MLADDGGDGGGEFVHFGLRAHGDADFGGPGGPDAADDDFLRGHRLGEFGAGTVDFHHEEVGFAGDVLDALLLEEGEGVLADALVDGAALGDQAFGL